MLPSFARSRSAPKARLALAAAGFLCLLASSLTLVGTAVGDETVIACGGYPNNVFYSSSSYGMNTNNTCPGGSLSLSTTGFTYKLGQGVIWQTSAPAGLQIVALHVPAGTLYAEYINRYGGYFYWNNGKSAIPQSETGAAIGPFASNYFGFYLGCDASSCGPGAQLDVGSLHLQVAETSPPWLSSTTGIWANNGWIRGRWPLNVTGDSPSGICGIVANVDGDSLPTVQSSAQDLSRWHQCPDPVMSDVVATEDYSQGAHSLNLGAWDSASETAHYTKVIHIDNQAPAVSLSGPTDASSTAGVQHVTATATAGPSGVAGISCSVDRSPAHWYASSTAQVPVSGVGSHLVKCVAENRAVSASGTRGRSPSEALAMKIGKPTVMAVGFTKVVNGLRCHRTARRVRVTHCHVRSVKRRISVWVTKRVDGHVVRVHEHRVVRVVLEPRTVMRTRRRIRHGRPATVDGWLGTASGEALSGQRVYVLTAPDNSQSAYQVVAQARTNADGSWSARIPAGPSRLVSAAYGGGPTTQSSLAAPAHLVVPAKVELLSVTPRTVAWGGTVRLVGDLKGGYLPPGGALVRLRIGIGSALTTFGVHEHVGGSGRFTTTYTFGLGDPSTQRSYWFQIASLPMGDYPYAPASSRRISVRVGGHPG